MTLSSTENSSRLAVWASAFRPFFLVLPAYLVFSTLAWGLLLSGKVDSILPADALAWHIYEMLYGVGCAGMAGFVLTAMPEFYEDMEQVAGKALAALVGLWLAGRLAFWLIDFLGVTVVAMINLPFLPVLIALVAKPILNDGQRRHLSLALALLGLWLLQLWFFLSVAGALGDSYLQVLKLALGLFMILVLLSLRRIYTGVTNTWLEKRDIDEVFLARPPAYNVAILCLALYSAAEFYVPNNPMLGWLGLACGAALLNLLNDFFLEEARPLLDPILGAIAFIPVLMALGYAMLGIDYLNDNLYGLNHFRHLLTTGVLGLSFLMVMIIVGQVHTGRQLSASPMDILCIVLVLLATLARCLIPFYPAYTQTLYLCSVTIWLVPFALYLFRYYTMLTQSRVDGEPG